MAEDKKVLKVKDVSPSLIKRIENSYGPLDPENDFFTLDLDTYYKTSSVNKTTGSVSHDVIKLASFGDSLEKISNAPEMDKPNTTPQKPQVKPRARRRH